MKRSLLYFIPLLLVSIMASGQNRDVSGVVSDKADGTPVAGANVTVKGTGIGTNTDANGRFVISVPATASTLLISFIGFVEQQVEIPPSNNVTVSLEPSTKQLDEVVISVGRGSQRTMTDTPLPVDVLTANDLATTGQLTFDKTLQYRVPSFNTINTPVNDATSLLDPYELRNLGPSRTLILINGKRKNLSSLLYVQFSPGRGEK